MQEAGDSAFWVRIADLSGVLRKGLSFAHTRNRTQYQARVGLCASDPRPIETLFVQAGVFMPHFARTCPDIRRSMTVAILRLVLDFGPVGGGLVDLHDMSRKAWFRSMDNLCSTQPPGLVKTRSQVHRPPLKQIGKIHSGLGSASSLPLVSVVRSPGHPRKRSLDFDQASSTTRRGAFSNSTPVLSPPARGIKTYFSNCAPQLGSSKNWKLYGLKIHFYFSPLVKTQRKKRTHKDRDSSRRKPSF